MPSLRFAFIAYTKRADKFMQDPSFIYRCENLALALRAAGHTADLLHYTQFDAAKQYDAVIFHRPRYRFGFRRLLSTLRKNGSLVVADFDDLVFDPAWASQSPGVINELVSLKQTEKNFRVHQKAVQSFDRMTVSTQPLMQKITEQCPSASILWLPNTVHHSWYDASESERPTRPRLTYFPGTRSHDRDFALIEEPLQDFLHDNPEVQLHITGSLSQQLKGRDDQLLRFEKQPFHLYRKHVALSWINLAPLQETEFNRHKSALKVIEASYFYAPTLASPIPDMETLSHCGAHLMPPGADWYKTLAQLLQQEQYETASQGLREKLLRTQNVQQQASFWLEWLEL